MAEFWNRYTSITVSAPVDDTGSYPPKQEFTTNELDIHFEMYTTGEVEDGRKQEEDTQTILDITIHNLSNATHDSIVGRIIRIGQKSDDEVIVSRGSGINLVSGYVGNTGNLFTGEVIEVVRMRDNGGLMTKLSCVGSLDSLRDTGINKSFFMTNVKDMVKYVATEAGLPISNIEDTGTVYTGAALGKWIFFEDTAFNVLTYLTVGHGRAQPRMFFGMRDGGFYWESRENSIARDSMYVLDENTGLLRQDVISGGNINVVYSLTTFMLPTISKGSFIVLKDVESDVTITCRVIYEPTHTSTEHAHISEFQVLVDDGQYD